MNTYLLSSQAVGGLFAALLFLLSFLGVHIARLAKMGWSQTRKQPPDPPPKKEEEKPPLEREPIYYIVERKRRPPKNRYGDYGEPKKISFKE